MVLFLRNACFYVMPHLPQRRTQQLAHFTLIGKKKFLSLEEGPRSSWAPGQLSPLSPPPLIGPAGKIVCHNNRFRFFRLCFPFDFHSKQRTGGGGWWRGTRHHRSSRRVIKSTNFYSASRTGEILPFLEQKYALANQKKSQDLGHNTNEDPGCLPGTNIIF